jgi:hypothetical protein
MNCDSADNADTPMLDRGAAMTTGVVFMKGFRWVGGTVMTLGVISAATAMA